MNIELLYHPLNSERSVSPFDAAILAIVRNDDIYIVCPYIGLAYLRRIISVCRSWKLVTDIREWLASQSPTQRTETYHFLKEHQQTVRHYPMLHAKAVIGSCSAYIGSANLTDAGIMQRVEIGIRLNCDENIKELRNWFQSLWSQASMAALKEVANYIKSLPANPASCEEVGHSRFHKEERRTIARLVNLPFAPVSSAHFAKHGSFDYSESNEEEIVRRVRKLAPDRSLAERCLDLLSRAIRTSGLSENDERIYASLPSRLASIKIVVNQRDVIDWKWHKGQPVLGFIVERNWLHDAHTKIVHEIPKGWYEFRPRRNESDAPVWLRFPLATLGKLPEQLFLSWYRCIRHELTRGVRSSHRKHHKSALWRVLVDSDMREHVLNSAFPRSKSGSVADRDNNSHITKRST